MYGDPIGVGEEPYARGEYSSYVSGILTLVWANASAEIIATHLADIVSRMGLPPNKEKSLHAAELILSHRDAIDEGCALTNSTRGRNILELFAVFLGILRMWRNRWKLSRPALLDASRLQALS